MEAGVPAVVILLVFFCQTFALLNSAAYAYRRHNYREWVTARTFQVSMVALLFSGTALDFMNQSFKNAWLIMACALVLYRESRKVIPAETLRDRLPAGISTP